MSAPGLVRPAARSAAVRPRSASFPSPRPARPGFLRTTRWRASLFFAPFAPALWEQSYWRASPCRALGPGGVVTGTALGTVLVTPKPLQLLDISKRYQRYHASPARVMHSRARACAILSLSLVTWEQERIIYIEQGLAAFPRPFPPLGSVVTWEQASASARASHRQHGGSNKVEGGYGDPRRAGGAARQKFRGAIAVQARPIGRDLVVLELAGALELGRIQLRPTRRRGNGGKPPFVGAAAGRVGRPVLEGSRQGAEKAAFLALRPKLGRLRSAALGELGAPELRPSARMVTGHPGAATGPRAPNRAPTSPAMLALHAGRIWIERRALGRISPSHYSNRSAAREKNPQTSDRRRGPGGARFSKAAEMAVGTRGCEAGERAGVNSLRLVAGPHDAGETTKLRRVFGGVKPSSAAVVDKLATAA